MRVCKRVLFVCLVTRHASKTRRRCAMQHQQALLDDHIISRHSLLSVSQSPPILQRHKHHFLLVLHPLLQTSILKSELTADQWRSFLSRGRRSSSSSNGYFRENRYHHPHTHPFACCCIDWNLLTQERRMQKHPILLQSSSKPEMQRCRCSDDSINSALAFLTWLSSIIHHPVITQVVSLHKIALFILFIYYLFF